MMTNGVWLMIVGSILIICAVVIYRMKTALDFYRVQEQELDQYAVEVETIYNQMRGIRHDYRNHLQVMNTLMRDRRFDDLDAYIKQLNNELNQVDTIIQTGNTMIDAIVNTKLTAAKNQGVELDATAIAPKELVIEHVDLAVILGNLLNNAIEATTKSGPANEDTFIRLYIAPMKHTLYISVTNTMTENPKPAFLSLKGVNRRGYGLLRIDQAVNKYQGIVNRKWEEGVFATEVTLPLNNHS
ncbi:GHKL domain-containing protein [Alkalibacterium sp. m-11]|uniref:Sensor_kinase_SpoOB-type, alpha-helical domain n=1 Tax=Alkalibacterium thalassium TaxID=426701 RepID=A0A1G9E261_9LACT|nr:GHKL domain-containing protein [Alkalibacterium thalassium]SDK70160.1 Sensor_kinase_SpoOB-type, alpha-helical domain [Alkalibacterium thalassium]